MEGYRQIQLEHNYGIRSKMCISIYTLILDMSDTFIPLNVHHVGYPVVPISQEKVCGVIYKIPVEIFHICAVIFAYQSSCEIGLM